MPKIARWCFRHRRLVVLLWVLALIGLGASSAVAKPKYSDDFNLPDTESTRALNLLKANAPAQAGENVTIVVHALNGTLDDPATKTQIDSMLADVRKVPHVGSVGAFDQVGSGAIDPARKIGFVPVQLDALANDIPIPDLKNLVKTAQKSANPNLQVELGGTAIQFASGNQGGDATEFLGIIAAAIVLFIAFGSIFTMFLPLLTALLALGTGLSIVGFLTHAFSIAAFGPTLAALIGLGVGIDYALFIVSRHRVNLQHGYEPEESVVTSIDTSGRAVVFAGITVCIGILGLMLLGVSFLYGLALSTVVAVVMTMLAAITFLPAMLGFVGMKALSKKHRKELAEKGAATGHEDLSPGWFRWAKIVQRHAFALGTLALVALLVLAIPVLSLRLGNTDAGGDPADRTTRKAYDLLAEGFGKGFNGPLQLVAQLSNSGDYDKFKTVVDEVAKQHNVASVTPPAPLPGGKVAMSQIYPKTSPQSKETTQLIDDLRSDVTHPFTKQSGTQVYIGGTTAVFHDFTNVLADKLPLFVGVVVALAFLLLMAVFRSLLVPVVASIMNLLSAGASFGIVVAIFQWGWGASVFGIEQTGPIQAFLPVMAFAILFGLSMDYEVFLVSRMYEEWHRTGSNEEAVTLGQAETGRVITAAAAIMVFIFISFVFGGEPTIKLFGIALASAVLLDAMIVRTVLVPAIMNALGKANWYLPKWLDRILPKLNVEPPRQSEPEITA